MSVEPINQPAITPEQQEQQLLKHAQDLRQQISARSQETHVIHFYCPIHVQSIITFSSLCLTAIQQGAKKLDIHFSSMGGDLCAGFSAYNFLRSLPIPVRMYNFGNVESVAVIMYLAADERFVVPHGRFLLHPCSWDFTASSVDHARLSERSGSLDFDVRRYAALFKERTDGCEFPVDIDKCLSSEALFLDAPTACAAGISTDITAPESTTPSTPTNWWMT